ncbi:MAG TPA: hypothetical protein VM639_05775 [Dongiaceae bacterium]|nr:hypothetical protein [Dongiaceae bacterium]
MTAKKSERDPHKQQDATPPRRSQPAKDKAEQRREEEDRLPVNPYPLNQESDRPGAPIPPSAVPLPGGSKNR